MNFLRKSSNGGDDKPLQDPLNEVLELPHDPFVEHPNDPHDYGVPFNEAEEIRHDELHPLLKFSPPVPYGGSPNIPINDITGFGGPDFARRMRAFSDAADKGFESFENIIGKFEASELRNQLVNGFNLDMFIPSDAKKLYGIARTGARLAKRTGSLIKGFRGNGGGGNLGGGSTGSPIQGGGGYVDYNRLTDDLLPTEVRLNTGIKSQTFVPDYNFAEDNYNSPLHISGQLLTIPNNTTTLAGNYWKNAVAYELVNVVQRNVTFSISTAVPEFSVDNLTLYLNAVLKALSIYYSMTRLLVYGNDPMNKNEALLYMRNTISSTVADQYLQLKRLLQGIPIPPNLNLLAFWTYQIYCSSDVCPEAPLIMFSPTSWPGYASPSWSEISTCITDLQTTTNIRVGSVLGRAIPNWYSTQLLTGIPNPLHDPGFITAWCNAPYNTTTVAGTTTRVGPVASSDDSAIKYNSFTDNLDGAIFALTSCYTSNTSSTATYPGLLQPVTSLISAGQNSNRYSWVGTALGGFSSPTGNSWLSYSRDETYTFISQISSTDPITSVPIGSERCWGVTPRVITATCYELLDWLVSWDTIPSPTYGDLKDNPSRKGSSGKSGKRKGKSKPKKSGS